MLYSLKRLFFPICCSIFLIASCDKVNDLPFYTTGNAPVLSTSATDLILSKADSGKSVIRFSWTNPKYANKDSSTTRYIVQIDSAGKNFSNPIADTIIGHTFDTLTASKLNDILLFKMGYNVGYVYGLDIRVVSSYNNYNEVLVSNSKRITAKTYSVPALVAPPISGQLFLVGDATQGGWNNPVPVPSQEFTKIDSLNYSGIFNLNANGQYLMLPVNGDWGSKFAVAKNSLPGLSNGGSFGFGSGFDDNFPGPATAGNYKISVDFLHGKFKVTKQ